MLVECVEARSRAPRAATRIRPVTGEDPVHAGGGTIDAALALKLERCLAAVERPERNGRAEAFA